ncbi:nuclear transport factor 2 family protein [Flavitalea flava]
MTRKIILPSLILLALAACGDPHSFKKAEDAQDAGREFIRASLDGNYEKAYFYLFADSTNQMLLGKWKKDYDRLDQDKKSRYKEADIMPININTLNDSVTTYTYANSYKKDTTTFKIVRIKGEWLVDLKEILNPKK